MKSRQPLKVAERAIDPAPGENAPGDDAPDQFGATIVPGSPWERTILEFLPGLVLAVGIAIAATLLRMMPGLSIFSAMILSAVIGMGISNLFGRRESMRTGIAFSMRLPLRAGIVLLGLQLTLWQLVSIGAEAFAVVISVPGLHLCSHDRCRSANQGRCAAHLSACRPAPRSAARRRSSRPIPSCGRRMAMSSMRSAVSRSWARSRCCFIRPWRRCSDWSRSYSGSGPAHRSTKLRKWWALPFSIGDVAGEAGTIAKLTRVLMLAPVVLLLPFMMARHRIESGDEDSDTVVRVRICRNDRDQQRSADSCRGNGRRRTDCAASSRGRSRGDGAGNRPACAQRARHTSTRTCRAGYIVHRDMQSRFDQTPDVALTPAGNGVAK